MEEPIIGTKRKVSLIDRALAATVLKLIPESIRPNQVTGFRFVMIPFVAAALFLKSYHIGLALFLIAAFSDAVDGAMARTRKQITEWGKIYDPLADKFLIGSTAVILLSRFTSSFLVWAIIVLEVLLIINAVYQIEGKKRVVHAVLSGKIKMFLQCVGVGFVFLFALYSAPWLLHAANITLYVSLLFGMVSLVVYRSI